MAMANHIASMHPASAPSNVKECWGLGRSLMEQSSFTMDSPADLATLRICDSENCEFKVLANTSASNTPAVAALISGQQGQSQDTAPETSQDTAPEASQDTAPGTSQDTIPATSQGTAPATRGNWGGDARASDSGQQVQRMSCSCDNTSDCCPRWLRWKKPWPKSCSGFHASRQEDLRGSGSSLHISRRFESTPADERHRSKEPVRSRGSVHSTQGVSAPPAGSPEFREYGSDTVQGGHRAGLDLRRNT